MFTKNAEKARTGGSECQKQPEIVEKSFGEHDKFQQDKGVFNKYVNNVQQNTTKHNNNFPFLHVQQVLKYSGNSLMQGEKLKLQSLNCFKSFLFLHPFRIDLCLSSFFDSIDEKVVIVMTKKVFENSSFTVTSIYMLMAKIISTIE